MIKIKRKIENTSAKIKKTSVESKIVTDIDLKITEGRFMPVFTETAPKVERNKKK